MLYRAQARDGKFGRQSRHPRLKAKNNPKVEVRNIRAYSPLLRKVPWQDYYVKDGSKGPMVWQAKRLRVYGADEGRWDLTSSVGVVNSHNTFSDAG